MKLGVVLFNLGAPESLDQVEPYLAELFSDRYILPLPGFLRRPLARSIARKRAPESKENYRKIGGGSPLLARTREQAEALGRELSRRGHQATVTISMRAWKPRAEEAARSLEGIERGVMLPLYPQFARATTQSAREDFEEAWRRHGNQAVRWSVVRSFPDHPRYVAAVAADLREALARIPAGRHPTTALLFSAHGLPVRSARHPQETYPAEVKRSMDAVLAALEWRGRVQIAFQSRVGPVKWLEPYPEQAIETMRAQGVTDAVVYPIAFVSDHSETLFELDQLYGDQARAAGLAWHRVPALNDRPAFIAALADLVESALA